jgi:hypothetical protein
VSYRIVLLNVMAEGALGTAPQDALLDEERARRIAQGLVGDCQSKGYAAMVAVVGESALSLIADLRQSARRAYGGAPRKPAYAI